MEAHVSHSQKHSTSHDGFSFSLSPAIEGSWSDLGSNSKSFPSCKYRKTAEHSGLAHFEITVSHSRGAELGDPRWRERLGMTPVAVPVSTG